MQTSLHSPCMCHCFQGLCIALRLSLSHLFEETRVGGLCWILFILAQPWFSYSLSLKVCIKPCFLPSCYQLLSLKCSFMTVNNPPAQPANPTTQTPQVFSSLPVLWRACSSLSLFTLDFKANSTSSLPSTQCFFCVVLWAHPRVWSLASRFPSLASFENAFRRRLLWTISKLHGF